MSSIPVSLLCTLRAPLLDRELLAGAKPQRDPALERRGARVTSRRRRNRLASGLEGLVRQAESPPRGLTSVAPIARQDVLAARSQLLDLADRLRSDAPVDPQGVLLIRRFLCDTASPAYTPSEPTTLNLTLRQLSSALHPRPDRPPNVAFTTPGNGVVKALRL